MNKLKELLQTIDWKWIQNNPGRTYDFIKDLIALHIHDKGYIERLHEENLLLRAMIGSD